ncbi:MAG TPA: class I SAM-dependent methyltransferase [Spirochaetota bacterium]|nr:class I SAM-dependent methyltransferase [Spirochaetota bacterium]HPJ33317.1 class I SAM-dependent methyltransferase [Spirochaetota bacterium]
MKLSKPQNEETKAARFNEIAGTIFAPVYPVLAEIILNKTPVKKGICLDLGSGPGHLAMAVSGRSDFLSISFDLSFHAQKLALENISKSGLNGKVFPMQGDVHSLPFHDNSIELVVSRGSIFFWDEPIRVFNEIHRILKPGCFSFIGGGFGTPELKAEIMEKMEKKTGDFKEGAAKRMSPENLQRLGDALSSSIARIHSVEKDNANLWFIIQKEKNL